MPSGLTPKLPLIRGSNSSFELITSYKELVKQNFKNLILTNPGERVMNKDFGVGILKFLFGPNQMMSYSKIAGAINEQAVQDIAFDSNAIDSNIDPNLLNVRIVYSILPLETDDVIELTLPTD
jgi:hypothetical protein